jgi:hypothetical protein
MRSFTASLERNSWFWMLSHVSVCDLNLPLSGLIPMMDVPVNTNSCAFIVVSKFASW